MKRIIAILLISMLHSPFVNAQMITTYAGNGTMGYGGDGGLSTNAELDIPIGINFDKEGNLLICQHLLVRKVDKHTGLISTVAGSDTATQIRDDVPANTTQIIEPYSVCIDKIGNFYIADYWAPDIAIRKVDIATGLIDTFAGSRVMGNSGDDGPAKLAKFKAVTSICIDTIRNYMYISDAYNYRIRRVNMLTDTITAFAGTGINGYSGDNGLAINANFSRVLGICLDSVGNLYVGDWDNARIRKIDFVTGIVTTIAGIGTVGYGGDSGLAVNAKLKTPWALCIDKHGNLFFTDQENNRVRKVDVQTGIISTVAGTGIAGFGGDGGLAINANFDRPTGICIDRDDNLFVTDLDNHRVRKIALNESENVHNVAIDASYSIYPSPARDNVTITKSEIMSDVIVINIIGQAVIKQNINSNKTVLNISGLQSGVYFIKVSDKNGGVVTRKFIKE